MKWVDSLLDKNRKSFIRKWKNLSEKIKEENKKNKRKQNLDSTKEISKMARKDHSMKKSLLIIIKNKLKPLNNKPKGKKLTVICSCPKLL